MKYRNKYTGGKHSAKEHKYGAELEFQFKHKIPHPEHGLIQGIYSQKRMPIVVGNIHICFYVVDYIVEYKNAKRYIDVKPTFRTEASRKAYQKTEAYRMFEMKRKLIKALYGIDIEIV